VLERLEVFSLAPWFGDLARSVNHYCERRSPDWDAEPVNAISNVAFLVAAFVAWDLQRRRPNLEFAGAIRALCIVTAIVGVGSASFHTLATRWAEWADVIPILVFMLIYCWLILTVFFRWPTSLKALATFLFFAVTFYLESDEFETILWGGAMYLPTLFLMLVAGVVILRRDVQAGLSFFTAAVLFVISFAARTLDQPLCREIPIGTHYFWHIFNAAVLYLLIRTLILHTPKRAPTRPVNAGRAFGVFR
jgi:hypothetical protein